MCRFSCKVAFFVYDALMNETIPIPEELLRVTEQPRACSYVPGETAALEYRIFRGLSPEQLECLLSRGWRRFGMHLFRPACSECRKCVPLRVDVAGFPANEESTQNFA